MDMKKRRKKSLSLSYPLSLFLPLVIHYSTREPLNVYFSQRKLNRIKSLLNSSLWPRGETGIGEGKNGDSSAEDPP